MLTLSQRCLRLRKERGEHLEEAGRSGPGTDNFYQVDDTATAILKKKKKPNSLMYDAPIYSGIRD